jgi:hypothetical protein
MRLQFVGVLILCRQASPSEIEAAKSRGALSDPVSLLFHLPIPEVKHVIRMMVQSGAANPALFRRLIRP